MPCGRSWSARVVRRPASVRASFSFAVTQSIRQAVAASRWLVADWRSRSAWVVFSACASSRRSVSSSSASAALRRVWSRSSSRRRTSRCAATKRIYGDYGTTIGQAQLESQFTGWQSRKLFALAEEVVSREEMRHYKGVLKHLITGNTLQINEKNMPVREESNHLNMVFLSNSTLPMALDDGDRRYLVLYVDRVMPKEYFDDLVAEIANGGVEAFYQYLMERDLTGFSPHTKPPLNEEKQGLIDGSLPAPRYFVRRWLAEETEFPKADAVHPKDLWRAFCRWCDGANEFRRRERDFHQEVARDLVRERVDIKYPNNTDDFKTTRLYVTKEFAAQRTALGRDWAGKVGIACRAFADSLSRRLVPVVDEA